MTALEGLTMYVAIYGGAAFGVLAVVGVLEWRRERRRIRRALKETDYLRPPTTLRGRGGSGAGLR